MTTLQDTGQDRAGQDRAGQDRAGQDRATRERFRRMGSPGGRKPPQIASDALPPGPHWPAWLQTMGLLRFRHRFHPWLRRTYGAEYTVRLLPQGRPLALYTRPEHAREIFAGDPEVFHAGKGNAILGPVMGRHSLLLQDGAEHARARRLLMPAFSPAALKRYGGLVSDLARDEAAHWPAGRTFRSLDRMNALTLEVILRVVFGVTDEARLAALRPRVRATVEVGPTVLMAWTYPRLQRIGPWKAVVDNAVELDRLLYAEIRERRAAADVAERHDVLSRLIRAGGDGGDAADGLLGDEELRDQLITLLLAGHETTATALAWALYELGRSPALQERSHAAALVEPDDPGAAEADAWLEAVVKESLRLHPVIPLVNRTLQRPATVAGRDLPAEVTVGPSIVVMHADPELYPRPAVFDPERFVGRNPAPHTWIPFGGGVRRCIGAGFSLMEGVAVLREVLRRHRLEAVGTDVPMVRNITSVPRHGARIQVTPR